MNTRKWRVCSRLYLLITAPEPVDEVLTLNVASSFGVEKAGYIVLRLVGVACFAINISVRSFCDLASVLSSRRKPLHVRSSWR
jgi:hypothetical protein